MMEMSVIAVEILLIILLVIANGIFAMSEIALVSSRKARLQQWANAGNAKARVALELANAPGRFLSTIQIGITLVGILAGAFGGATIAEKLAAALSDVPWIAPYRYAIGLGVVVLGITYLSLILGELVPKQLALSHPERLAAAVASPMHLLSRIAAPVVWLLTVSVEAVVRLLGIRAEAEPPVTEGEIKVLMQQGTEAGVFESAEHEMVRAVLRLGDWRVGAVMTLRTEIVWLDLDDTPEDIQRQIINSTHHSRLLVCQGSLDHVLGVVHTKDLLVQSLAEQRIDLAVAMQRPVFVPESIRALDVLELFKQSGNHMVLVVDEFGSIQGLVTLHDILEAVVGDMPAAGEEVEPRAVQRDDGSWLLDGLLPVDELKERFHLGPMPGEEQDAYQTLGGFVMTQLGRIPVVTDHFAWGELRFEVVDMDGHRVDKILVTPITPGSAPETAGTVTC
jgi:putative hemolysin